MIAVDLPALFERLNVLCRHALKEAGSLCIGQRGAEVTVPHLLFKLLDQPQCDVRIVLRVAGIEVDSRLQRLQQQFAQRYNASLEVADSARDELRSRCLRHANGARMLDASIDDELLPPLSLAVLRQQAKGAPFQRADLRWQDGAFVAMLHLH